MDSTVINIPSTSPTDFFPNLLVVSNAVAQNWFAVRRRQMKG